MKFDYAEAGISWIISPEEGDKMQEVDWTTELSPFFPVCDYEVLDTEFRLILDGIAPVKELETKIREILADLTD